ncbi:MAG TPA: hypothetical protein VE088_00460 [Gaiellaceae bacterium]|nr:hypothetical protein [Gaiellaceae bacterium]
MRAGGAVLAVAALVGAAAASAATGPPPLRHPNPLLSNPSLDYARPIPAPGGGFATLGALGRAAVPASVRDLDFLRYRTPGDWGGFVPAPVGRLALDTGGSVHSFVFGNGVRAPKPPPLPQPPLPGGTPVPPANGGFGGNTRPPRHHGGGGNGGGTRTGGAGNCGTKGLSIVSDLPHCRIHVVDQAPGDSTFEHLTIENTSSSRYTLSLQVQGSENALWNDLEMGVWRHGAAPPTPLPPLLFWATQFTPLITLDPGRQVRLTIELYLPPSAGNGDQKLAAVVDFLWRASS